MTEFSKLNEIAERQNLQGKRSGFFSFSGNFVKFITVSLAMAILMTLPGIAVTSFGIQAFQPIAQIWKDMPSSLKETSIAERNTLYDINGKPFAQIWVEDRKPLSSVDQISPYLREGLIATEDNRFYEHSGIDIKGTARAALTGKGGGSGITQQLVKNLQFYDQAGRENREKAVESTYRRKIQELKYSLDYEKNHSKDEILLQYFNTVSFGGPNTYSIESAAQYYFGKKAKDLNLAESSVLVGTVKNPVGYNLEKEDKREAWKSRQATVLQRMVSEGYITQREADEAKKEELKFVFKKDSGGNCASSAYPFYCDYVIDYLLNSPRFGETPEERSAILAKGGLEINTYMDPAVMDAIDERLEKDFGNNNRVVAPVSVVQPGTGAVLGFGQNRDYGTGEGKTTINVADNPAATGSAFKPFTLAAALENGFTESDLKFGSDCPYKPNGFDTPPNGFGNSNGCGFQSGVLDYQQATAWSSNTWYTTLGVKVGLENIFKLNESMGLKTPDGIGSRSLSYVLGPVEYSPIDVSAAYATFANKGVYCPPTPIKEFKYVDGTSPHVPDTYRPESDACRGVMKESTASTVLRALRANTYPGYVEGAFGTKAQIDGYDAVGKSGTNQSYNHIWAQVSMDYSLYIDIYDMDSVSRGLKEGYSYRGDWGSRNKAPQAGSRVLKEVVDRTGVKSRPLDYDNRSNNVIKVDVPLIDYMTIPDFTGMTAEEALYSAESLGIQAHVSVEKKPAPDGYDSGVIVEQSLKSGTQLPIGTKKEIVLYETK